MCHFSTPEYLPITHFLEYYSQSVVSRRSLAEFPGVQIPWPYLADWLHQNLSICTFTQHPAWVSRTLKFEKHCLGNTLVPMAHTGLDVGESEAIPLSSLNLSETLNLFCTSVAASACLHYNVYDSFVSVLQAKNVQYFYFKSPWSFLLPVTQPSKNISPQHLSSQSGAPISRTALRGVRLWVIGTVQICFQHCVFKPHLIWSLMLKIDVWTDWPLTFQGFHPGIFRYINASKLRKVQ